ncbi:MAG: SCP2 sterol-binding domain-containing protein [Actinomycetota bacterium]
MSDIGTEEWIERLRTRAGGLTTDAAVSLRIEQRITDTATWHLIVADGTATADVGPIDDPDVTITVAATTATEIARGERSAQRAFLDGDLRIGGDVDALLRHRDVLSALAVLLRAT